MIELDLDDIYELYDGHPLRYKNIQPTLAAWWDLEGRWMHAAASLCDKLVWYN
jgi:hypothetical protein